MKKYRNNGAIGALLDEYEKAIIELQSLLKEVSNAELSTIVNKDTKDKDCESIQSILNHVLQSGYLYAVEIRNHQGENLSYHNLESYNTINVYLSSLHDMFTYNEKLFQDYPHIQLVEKDNSKKIKVRWGQYYDVEQLMEHAIVHILRHRRQIEKFVLKLRESD